MFSLGLVGKDGKPPHLSTIQKILINPFDYGHFHYCGKIHQGSHNPMIAKKLFQNTRSVKRQWQIPQEMPNWPSI